MAKSKNEPNRDKNTPQSYLLSGDILGNIVSKDDDLKGNLTELQIIKKLNSQSSDNILNQLNNRLSDLNMQQQRLKEKIEAQDRKITSDKNRTIETLGVFVALFTFISTQIQIFRTLTDPKKIIALSLVSGGLITFFVLILDLMVKTRDEADGLMRLRFFLLLGLSVGLISVGTLLISST